MKLIVGLGNPGQEYEKTRHNVGFLCLKYIAEKLDLTFKYEASFEAMVATKIIDGEKCFFVMPMTYMNLSGNAVSKICRYYKIDLKDFIVIYDDMDLPIGKLRLREKGSAGGHNGIKNIILCLGTDEFKRIRVGISSHANIDAKDYVLGHFSKEDLLKLKEDAAFIYDAIREFIEEVPFTKIMGKYNLVK